MVARALKKGVVFKTGTGRPNRVIKTNGVTVYIRSDKQGSAEIDFPVRTIISAAAFFIRVRHVERKELEVFHSFSSALFGMLARLFAHRARIQKGMHGLLRLLMRGIRFYLAGADKSPSDLRLASAAGAQNMLMSYFWLRNRPEMSWKGLLTELGLRLLLDSGAYSVWRARLKGHPVEEITLDEYCAFINRHIDILDGYFVLDKVADHEATMRNLREMESRGLNPIPVYHMGTPVEELDKLVARGYPVIGLGGTVGMPLSEKIKFLRTVFDRHPDQAFHGLGISHVAILGRFGLFSADSRTWLNGRIDGRLINPLKSNRGKIVSALAENARFFAALEEPENHIRLSNQLAQLA